MAPAITMPPNTIPRIEETTIQLANCGPIIQLICGKNAMCQKDATIAPITIIIPAANDKPAEELDSDFCIDTT